jgi:hypothetical protein
MGAHPYWYVVPYDADIPKALQELREREFDAGRYHPVIPFLHFPLNHNSPAPGSKHESIEEAIEAADADGTRSILDIYHISEEPEFNSAHPLSDEVLQELYGTTKPTREAVEANMDFMEDLERGQAVYIVLYKNKKHHELMFAGYSFD